MSRRTMSALVALLPLLAAAGCTDRPAAVVPKEQAPVATPAEPTPETEGFGTITGRVVFAGEQPEEVRINVSADVYFGSNNPDGIVDPRFEVNDDGTVPHVALVVRGPTADPDRHPVPTEPVTIFLDDGAMYVPHVTAVRAGQPVLFENRAQTCM